MTNKYFILAFVFGLNLWSGLVTAAPNSLIGKSCHGLGSFEKECLTTLQSAPKHQQGDVKGLALFTLRFVETNLANLTTVFKGFSEEDTGFPPLLKQALKDCVKEYIPLGVLVKESINGVSSNSYPEADKTINKAIYKFDKCDRKFKQDPTKEKSSDENEVTSGMKKTNLSLRNFLVVTLNILKAKK